MSASGASGASAGATALSAVLAVLKVFVIMAFGVYLQRRALLPLEACRFLARVYFNAFLPSLLFTNLVLAMAEEQGAAVGMFIVLTLLQFAVWFPLAFALRWLLAPPKGFANSLIPTLVFGNCGDMVLSLMASLTANAPFEAGDAVSAAGYVSLYVGVASIGMFTIGEEMVEADARWTKLHASDAEHDHDHEHEHEHEHDEHDQHTAAVPLLPTSPSVASTIPPAPQPPQSPAARIAAAALHWAIVIASPPIIAVVFGVLCGSVPQLYSIFVSSTASAPLSFIFQALQSVGGATVPTGLVLVGANLASLSLKPALPLKFAAGTLVLRQLIMPALGVTMVYLLCHVAQLPYTNSRTLQAVLIVETCVPTATNILLLVINKNLDPTRTGYLFLLQYIVAVPITIAVAFVTLYLIQDV